MPTTPGGDAMRLLSAARTIAVVGASSSPGRPSYEVAEYLLGAGYTVYLVDPAEDGPILGLPVYDSLLELPEPVDIVDVFRRPNFVGPVVEDAIAAGAGAVWMQLEIINEDAARIAREAGLEVVMDRCTKIDHQELVAREDGGSGSR
ncbi:MAG: CoA-binding protein [Dehalococcoidia bacterium]|nr:CoA-binding protein [Dehalococcoidia bacterium]